MFGLRRKHIDSVIDQARFWIDTRPQLDYQPLPWLGLMTARRDAGCKSRWSAIEAELAAADVSSAMDIGCNVGWFTFNLAQKGIATLGVEQDPKFYRTMLYAKQRMAFDNVAVQINKLSVSTAALLPNVDATLVLAVWHHLVRYDGVDTATSLLQQLWHHTNKVLFFETGESEIPDSWGLPGFVKNTTGIEAYLTRSLSNCAVVNIGRHDAFAPDRSPCKRTLWALHRTT